MGAVDGLAGRDSKRGLVAIASTARFRASLAKWLTLVTFDLPDSIAILARLTGQVRQ